jgi:hypothetical protein
MTLSLQIPPSKRQPVVIMRVASILLGSLSLQTYILRKLIKTELTNAKIPHLTRKSFVGVISYLLGVAATWLNVHIAFILYALTPLFFITPPQGDHRR